MEHRAAVLLSLLGPGGELSAPSAITNSNKPHRDRRQGAVSVCGGEGSQGPAGDQ